MPPPLSTDLRLRVVNTYQSSNLGFREVAAMFSIGEATVNRWVSQFRKTGSLEPLPARGGKAPQLEGEKLDAVHILVLEKPDLTQREIASALQALHHVFVSRSTVSRALKRLDLTRKKRRLRRRSETPSE